MLLIICDTVGDKSDFLNLSLRVLVNLRTLTFLSLSVTSSLRFGSDKSFSVTVTSVCLCVSPFCLDSTFERLDLETVFGLQVHLQNISVKFLYQGHQVWVKVTGAKRLYDHN